MRFELAHARTAEDRLVLAPWDDAAERFLSELTDGEPIELEALHPRDMVEHRRIFAYLNDLAAALHKPPELVRAELLYGTGNFHLLGSLIGKAPVIAVHSMSRHSMKDEALRHFWNDAREIILKKMIPQIKDDAIRERLTEQLLFSPVD